MDRVHCASYSITLNNLATGTPNANSSCGSSSSRMGGSSMMGVGQSRKDPNTRMSNRKKSSNNKRYQHRVISPDIALVDSVSNKSNPNSYTKDSLYIATWNVRTLVNTTSKLYELSQIIDVYKLDLLCLTETHMPGTGTQLLDNGSLFIHSGRIDGIRRQGVGLSLSKRIKNTLISYTPVSERIMSARLHSRQINISVIVAYAPTEDAEETVKTSFYQQLSDTYDELPGHDIKLVVGDFNARVTSDHTTRSGVIGKHSLHQVSNDNGTRLLDFCALNGLTVGGTLFQHNDIHKGTWRSPDGRTVTQIDHICISTNWNHSLLDVRSYRGADIGSDHYLVRGQLRVKLQSVKKCKSANRKIPAIDYLRDKSKVEDYNIALSNRFSSLPLDKSLDETWEEFKNVVDEVSMEVLGERPKKRRHNHLSQETKQLLNDRSAVKRRDPSSSFNRSEYSRLNKLVKKSCKIDDNKWALRIASDLEDAASKGQQREVWQKIKVLSSSKRVNKSTAVRDKSGKLISNPEAQRERWAEHFSELLNPSANTADLSDLDDVPEDPCFQDLDDEPPTRGEILAALSKLKNYKSPGVDGITNEQLKYGKLGMVEYLRVLFKQVWDEEKIPGDWSKGIIITLGKKGDTSICSNNRGITLRSTASKVYQMIILQRLHNGLESLLRENQCGFRRNRSCVDQIYSLRTIIYNCIEHNISLYINFVDFKAAFDSINRDFIWRAFAHYGLPEKYIRIIKAFFCDTTSAVRVNGELSDWFAVNSGTGQGDIQGPPIFNVCLNFAAQLAEQNKTISRGLVLQKSNSDEEADTTVMDTDYADDMAVLDNSKSGLQESTDLLCKYSAYSGLRVNANKTKTMAINKSAGQQPYTEACSLDTTVENAPVEQVSHFTYLGTVLSSDGTLDRELTVRIQKASGAFKQLYRIWNNRNIFTSTKIRIYKSAVITILIYGSEAWNTTKLRMKRMEVFHQRCLRRILKIRWQNHVKNEEVLKQAQITSIEVFIASMRLRWYGHVVRMPDERLPKYILDNQPNYGKRTRGRPRKSWLSCIVEDANNFTGNGNLKLEEVRELALDRKHWREMIRHKRVFVGAGHSND